MGSLTGRRNLVIIFDIQCIVAHGCLLLLVAFRCAEHNFDPRPEIFGHPVYSFRNPPDPCKSAWGAQRTAQQSRSEQNITYVNPANPGTTECSIIATAIRDSLSALATHELGRALDC